MSVLSLYESTQYHQVMMLLLWRWYLADPVIMINYIVEEKSIFIPLLTSVSMGLYRISFESIIELTV